MHKYVSIESVGKTFETKKGGFVALADIRLQISSMASLMGAASPKSTRSTTMLVASRASGNVR